MRKHERRTREQRKADASAWMGFMSFLALLLITIAYMVVSARRTERTGMSAFRWIFARSAAWTAVSGCSPRTHRLSTMYSVPPAALSQRVTPSNPTPRKRGREGMRGNEDLSGVRKMFRRYEPQCV